MKKNEAVIRQFSLNFLLYLGMCKKNKNTNRTSVSKYNRFDIKGMMFTERDTYCQLDSLSSLLPFHTISQQTRKPNTFFLLFFTLSFLLISFSFSWNVHWVLSLSTTKEIFYCMEVKGVASCGILGVGEIVELKYIWNLQKCSFLTTIFK